MGRIIEATLMGTHAQVLQLRSRVMKNENRSTMLANELRRVLHSMPEMIEKTVARMAEAKKTQRAKDVEALKLKHQKQVFKFMEEDLLREKESVVTKDVQMLQRYLKAAKAGVQETTIQASDLVRVAAEIDEALYTIRDAWLLVPMHFQLLDRHRGGDISMADDGQMIVSKATVAAKSIRELLHILSDSTDIHASVTERELEKKMATEEDRRNSAVPEVIPEATQNPKKLSVTGTLHVCHCGNVFMADAQFCRKCGAPRPSREKKRVECGCGNIFLDDSNFCRKCAAPRPTE